MVSAQLVLLLSWGCILGKEGRSFFFQKPPGSKVTTELMVEQAQNDSLLSDLLPPRL